MGGTSDLEFIKTIISKILYLLLHIFELVPFDKNKILFYPSNGNYYCNLKYIDAVMRSTSNNYKLLWICDSDCNESYPRAVRKISRHSFMFLYHFYTSKVILFNDGLPNYLYKKKGQVFIETWHGGGAYKKIDAVFKNESNTWRKWRRLNFIKQIDYIVSSCKKFSEVFRNDTMTQAVFIPSGMPRNDLFFKEKLLEQKENLIRRLYNIPKEKRIVLYAPTFRDKSMVTTLNIELLLFSLQNRFNREFVFLLRSHPHITQSIFNQLKENEVIIDVSNYPDMQELLAAADILITDYSSCIWDYSFTYRPCFIYADDLNEYKESRNFHTPIESWPFPLSQNNEELKYNISVFDENLYRNNIIKHHKELGSYESGVASEKICQIVCNIFK